MANAAGGEGPGPGVYTTTLPICVGIPDDKNGTLTLRTAEPYESLQDRLEGVFSVVLYVQTKAQFLKSLYYKGIYHMLKILHVYKKRFNNWGLVLYTNRYTRRVLEEVFPLSKFPRLILVEVDWPMYTDSNGNVECSILRCLRFQVVDLFTDQLCLVRDADTLFPRLLKGTDPEDYQVTAAIAVWEDHFINRWQTQIEESPLLVIGTHYLEILGETYLQNWHRNTPLALALPLEVIDSPSIILKSRRDVSFGGRGGGTSLIGVFAGFVNFRNTRGAFHALWKLCVEYLQERFFMVRIPMRDPKWGGYRVISDYYSNEYYGATVGKDEKCILFVISRYYLDTIYYFDLHYFTENTPETQEHPDYVLEVYVLEKGPGNKDYGYKWLESLSFKDSLGKTYAYSLLLNPESIDVVLDQSVVVFEKSTNSEMAYRHYDYFKQMMKAAMAHYEHWLSSINPEEIKAEIGAQLRAFLETSPEYQKLLEGELDNGFLKKAQIFTTDAMEKQILKGAVELKAANKAAQAAQVKPALPAVGGIPGAEVDPALRNRRRNRRNRASRRIKKRKNRTTRRR